MAFFLGPPCSHWTALNWILIESHWLNIISRSKSRLSDLIEPDFGLLEQLLSLEVLTRRQYEDVRSETGATYRKSSALLDMVVTEDQCRKFVTALRRTSQNHVANSITQFGG